MKRYLRSKPVVTYYWYDRGEIRNTPDMKLIEDCFKNKDYETFMKMREKYPPDPNHEFEYFPDTATIYDMKNDVYLGELDITNQENFNKIDEAHYEWG